MNPVQPFSTPSIRLGVCPAHFKFADVLAPDENGKLPRHPNGQLKGLTELKQFLAESPVRLSVIPMFTFSGTQKVDLSEALDGIQSLGVKTEAILMINGADPMNPEDEDKFVALAMEILEIAKSLNIEAVCSTTFEQWMDPAPTKTGDDYDAAVAQLIKAHQRVFQEADLANSSMKSWHMEFLRPVEFSTFTNIRSAWDVVKGINEKIGTNFFRVLVDASHCGDSGLTVEDNQTVIREIAAAGGLGAFHASSKTTRGCLTTDEGWIDSLLSTCLETGELDTVIVEAFDHTDEGLQALRDAVPGHGVDTTMGRSYNQLIFDGLAHVNKRLNERAHAHPA